MHTKKMKGNDWGRYVKCELVLRTHLDNVFALTQTQPEQRTHTYCARNIFLNASTFPGITCKSHIHSFIIQCILTLLLFFVSSFSCFSSHSLLCAHLFLFDISPLTTMQKATNNEKSTHSKNNKEFFTRRKTYVHESLKCLFISYSQEKVCVYVWVSEHIKSNLRKTSCSDALQRMLFPFAVLSILVKVLNNHFCSLLSVINSVNCELIVG